jgi:ribosomal protein S27AE
VPGAVPETFAFSCGRCGEAWEATFQAVFFTDPIADPDLQSTQEYVDEAGRAVWSPLTDAVCPRCGSRKVRITAPGS